MTEDIDWMNASSDLGLVQLCRDMAALAQPVESISCLTRSVLRSSTRRKGSRSSIRRSSSTVSATSSPTIGRLDNWAASAGLPGLFEHTGIFSQYMIGGAELMAAALLLTGAFYAPYRFLLPLGALIGLAVMTGAVSFHLFTPLGVDPNNDGGGLFRAACLVWVLSLALLILRAGDLDLLGRRLGAFAAPA